MERGSGTSGSEEHVLLVKLTTKRIIDTFPNLKHIQISYEPTNEMNFEIKIEDSQYPYGSHSNVSFRPDIILRAQHGLKQFSDVAWSCITDSRAIIFEVETDPKNFFTNLLKKAAYQQLREKNRTEYSFILVCWEDTKLPDKITPFDEVWRFPKPSLNGSKNK